MIFSFLHRFRLKGRAGVPPELKSEPKPSSRNDVLDEPHLGSLNDLQLRDLISQQSERAITRLLQTLTDQNLQLRILQQVTQESTLKRVIRSELNKKLKRAAEKKLRETGTAGEKLRLQKLDRLSEKLRSFLENPKWPEARALLDHAFDPEALGNPIDPTTPPFAHFQALRDCLQREVEAYEKTCAEREDSERAPAKAHETKLREAEAREAEAREAHAREAEVREAARKRHELKARKEQEERKHRLDALEDLLRTLHGLSKNLGSPQTGAQLRSLKDKITAHRRWKKDYPAQLDEAEALLKNLLSRNTEVINEAQWDAWARTDRATRIQTELETLLGGIEAEAESDPPNALKSSMGLAQRLSDYATEMKEMGRLERGKDHQIWAQFKALNDRGWLLCDRMRLVVLEQLKEQLKPLLFEHASKPAASALGDEFAARVNELRSLWREIGAKPSDANRETETAFTRLFESYFRQRNLHLGQLRRNETNAIEKSRQLLNEMKIACEGKSTLHSRARVAKGLEERWKRAPLPETVAIEFKNEFRDYQARLNAELTEEAEKHVRLAADSQVQAQAVLEKLLAKEGVNLSQTLKTVSTLENELATLDKHLGQFKGLRQGVPGPADTAETSEARFQEVRDRLLALFRECRTAAEKELSERARERDRVILEAQALALSTDWESSPLRFEELRLQWKKVGVLGQGQDPLFEFLFENVCRFYLCRRESQGKTFTAEQLAQALRTRKELTYSLEALIRSTGKDARPLPLTEEERAKASGKILEFGLRYKHILSLDPNGGALKEIKKIMIQWSKLGIPDDERLTDFWNYYLDRVHALLEIRIGLADQGISRFLQISEKDGGAQR